LAFFQGNQWIGIKVIGRGPSFIALLGGNTASLRRAMRSGASRFIR
jgi:hypothetical protein